MLKEYIRTLQIKDGVTKPIFIPVNNICAVTPTNKADDGRCVVNTSDGSVYLINESYDDIVKTILKIY
jgi:hypothetical protein